MTMPMSMSMPMMSQKRPRIDYLFRDTNLTLIGTESIKFDI